MPGYTDKSRRYLRLAVENYKRSSSTEDPGLKRKLLEIAAGYRDLALQIDDPEKWRARVVDYRFVMVTWSPIPRSPASEWQLEIHLPNPLPSSA